MKMTNFPARKDEFQNLDTELYNRIVVQAADRRIDLKPRTGIETLLRELKTENKNLCVNIVGAPSDRAMYFAPQKSSVMEEHNLVTSEQMQDEKEYWAGGVSYKDGDQVFHSTCSGLLGEEDTVIAIIKLARALGITINAVIENIIKRDGKLPDEIHQEDHYLNEILNEYGAKEMLQ